MKPITGILKRRVIRDISVGLTLGTISAFAWWYTWRMPAFEKRQEFYRKLEAKKA